MADTTLQRARRMRKQMTPQELALWLRLREFKGLGWHFRRQSPEPPYILDFVCRAVKLVVEVDGVHHASAKQSAHDQERDSVLAARGFHVLRFWASDVESELDGVVEAILNALGQANPTRRAPPACRTTPCPEGKGKRFQGLVRLGLKKP